MHTDFIIVGQGIAGTMVAFQLLKRKKSFVVFDGGTETPASQVAGGIINPITGRRFVKSWRVDELIDSAQAIYRDLERHFNCEIIKEMPLFRILKSVKEQNDAAARFDEVAYRQHLKDGRLLNHPADYLINPFGGFYINALVVNAPVLLSRFRSELQNRNSLVEERFDINQMQVGTDAVSYQDIQAQHIIFCEGVAARTNPWFSDLEFVPAKGEALIIECPSLSENEIIGGQVHIAPLGKQRYYVGATVDWNDLTDTTTQAGKNWLVERLNRTINCSYEIIDQLAAVRPAAKDRRPFVGQSKQSERVSILNGLGTKGMSLAPFFAEELVRSL